MRWLMSPVVLVILFLFCAGEVRAAFSMNIQSVDPVSVSSNEQEVTITASISGLPNPSFFRIAWQKSSGEPYFGYVKNNSGDWVKIQTDQDCKVYYSISDINTNTLTLVAKIGDDNDPQNGAYNLKLRRYTSTCGSNSDSAPYPVEINLPTPTPTPTPTIIPTPVPTPNPTHVPTATPTLPAPVKTSTPKPKTSPTPEILGEQTGGSQTGILAPKSFLESPDPTPSPGVTQTNGFPVMGGVLIGLGAICVAVAVYLAVRKQKGTSTGIINE